MVSLFSYVLSSKIYPLLAETLHALYDAVNAFIQNALRAGDIDSDIAVFSVHRAGIDPYVELFPKLLAEFFCADSEVFDIYPGQICGLERGDLALRQFLLESLSEDFVIFPDILPQAVEPFFAFGRVCGLYRDGGELVEVAMLPEVDDLHYLLSDGVIGADDGRYLKSCHIP